MTRWEVDRAIGQTPCLCGDIETWHPKCYVGKSDQQIEKDLVVAYRIARQKLRAVAMYKIQVMLQAWKESLK